MGRIVLAAGKRVECAAWEWVARAGHALVAGRALSHSSVERASSLPGGRMA